MSDGKEYHVEGNEQSPFDLQLGCEVHRERGGGEDGMPQGVSRGFSVLETDQRVQRH